MPSSHLQKGQARSSEPCESLTKKEKKRNKWNKNMEMIAIRYRANQLRQSLCHYRAMRQLLLIKLSENTVFGVMVYLHLWVCRRINHLPIEAKFQWLTLVPLVNKYSIVQEDPTIFLA